MLKDTTRISLGWFAVHVLPRRAVQNTAAKGGLRSLPVVDAVDQAWPGEPPFID